MEKQDDLRVQKELERIVEMISAITGISIDNMKSKSRKRNLVEGRFIAMYFVKNITHLPLKTIGAWFGNRDHTTVIHALNTIEDLRFTDSKFDSKMDTISKMVSPIKFEFEKR